MTKEFYCPKCEDYKDEATVLADAQVRYPSSDESDVSLDTVLTIVGYECMECGSIDVVKTAEFGAGEEVEVECMTLMDHVNA